MYKIHADLNYININRFRIRKLVSLFTGSFKDFYVVDNVISDIKTNVSTCYGVIDDLYNMFRLFGIIKFQPFKYKLIIYLNDYFC